MSRQPLVNIFAPWIAVAALWLWLFSNLQVDWSLNPQYNYGWAVPFLALLMFWFRWQRRPVASPATKSRSKARWAAWTILLLLLPIRVVEESNPDWRFFWWVLGVCGGGFFLFAVSGARR